MGFCIMLRRREVPRYHRAFSRWSVRFDLTEEGARSQDTTGLKPEVSYLLSALLGLRGEAQILIYDNNEM
jgi:hypothetical protein